MLTFVYLGRLGADSGVPLRSSGGAVLVLTLALYPYVYMLARVAFRAVKSAQELDSVFAVVHVAEADYQLVKDLRTDYEVGNAQSVLDGALDGFVHSYLLAKAAGKVL